MNTDLPIGDLDNWRQIFTDNFSTDVALGEFPAAVDDEWKAYPSAWKDSSRHGTYSPKLVVSIVGGVLTKHIHTEAGVHMIAAILPRVPGSSANGQMYGRYALCWRSEPLPGYKIAWLLWPDSNLRTEGEIDWPEMNLDADQVGGFVHRIDGEAQSWVYAPIDTDVWNVSVMEWSPGLIVFLHNGVEVFRSDQGIPNRPMHWVIQTETELSPSPAPADDISGDVEIKWVAAWQWDPTAKAPPKPRQLTLVAPATVSGITTLGAESSDDVTQTKWVVDGIEVGYDSARPFARPWDTTRFQNGVHEIYAKARDVRGWFDGARRTITVKNPWHLLAPQTATGVVTVGVTPYPWFQGVKWVLDGREIGSRIAAPFEMLWDSRKVPNGVHTVYVKIRDDTKWYDGPYELITVDN